MVTKIVDDAAQARAKDAAAVASGPRGSDLSGQPEGDITVPRWLLRCLTPEEQEAAWEQWKVEHPAEWAHTQEWITRARSSNSAPKSEPENSGPTMAELYEQSKVADRKAASERAKAKRRKEKDRKAAMPLTDREAMKVIKGD